MSPNNKEGKCHGNFVRLRTRIDITKPIRQGDRVRLGNGGIIVWADLQYEKLPYFCYCLALRVQYDMEMEFLPYDDWLQVKKPNFSLSYRYVSFVGHKGPRRGRDCYFGHGSGGGSGRRRIPTAGGS